MQPGWEPEFLKALPRPPAEPRSLFAPPLPPGPPPPDLERPYFQRDPLLDPPNYPVPGWFGLVDLGILKPHLKNQLVGPVTFADGTTATVGLPAATLDWTVAPRFEVGCRLPSGFGGISLAYRFIVSQGTNAIVGPDGPATLSSRFDVNVADLDWSSAEFSPYKLWDMTMRFGLRYMYVYFDSQANESSAEAAAGSGLVSSRTTNSYAALGPHAAVQLTRWLGDGWAVVGKIDGCVPFGRIRQGFFASSTALGANGLPASATDFESGSQSAPTLYTSLGLSWQPPGFPTVRLYGGYVFEYWWNVGRHNPSATPPASFGDFFDQGVVLQAAINF
jgi:hypothetical protein